MRTDIQSERLLYQVWTSPHGGVLPPIVVSLRAGPCHVQDYLMPDKAKDLALALLHAASEDAAQAEEVS
jgi:hypothetical protein